jgi:hypothetical protein
VETRLSEAEKLANSYQRDRAYSQAVISLVSVKDFSQALKVLERISDLTQNEQVKQFLYAGFRADAIISRRGRLRPQT